LRRTRVSEDKRYFRGRSGVVCSRPGDRLWKTERGSFLCSGYSIFVFRKSFRLCLSLISCTIEVGAKEELDPGCMQDVGVFSQALILRASCILDPRCDSVVVSRGLLMIFAVPVRCCLVGLFPSVKFSSWLCAGFCVLFFQQFSVCSFLLSDQGFSGFQSMCTFPVSGTFVQ
jgi:hypothetical protein